MATPDDRTGGLPAEDDRNAGFPADPESSAGGGHIPSVARPSGSLFDTADAHFPSDIEREREQNPEPPRDVFAPVPGPRPAGTTQQMRRRPRGKRRVRRTIRSIDPWSVLKVSFLFYVVLLVIWLVFVAILYNVLEAMGLFEAIENINEGLVLEAEFDVTVGVVMRWAALFGVLFVVVGSIVNTLIALVYNGIARLVGGLEVTFVEREG